MTNSYKTKVIWISRSKNVWLDGKDPTCQSHHWQGEGRKIRLTFGVLPTKNWQQGTFDGWEKIQGGELTRRFLVKN
jgi:aldehyde:ferredoxin oxidoreductase